MTHPKPPYTRFGNRTDKDPYDRIEEAFAAAEARYGRSYTEAQRQEIAKEYEKCLNRFPSPRVNDWTPPPQAAAHIKAERAEQRRIILALAGLAVSLAVGFWTGAALERFWTEQNAAAVEGVK